MKSSAKLKYSLDENKLQSLLGEKIQNYFLAATKVYEELNPKFLLTQEDAFSEEESKLLESAENGLINPAEIPISLLEKVKKINDKLEMFAENEKAGNINLKLFTIAELKKMLEITEEDIKKILYNGQEEESLSKS